MMKLTDAKSNNIQILRGLAIIAVVFIHNTPVGLFLFLSGMLSNVNNWNPRKRIIKVVIPYILWSLVYVILYNLKRPTMLPILYLKDLLTGGAAAIMYYVFVYSEFTLLIPLIDKLAKSKYKYLGFIVSPVEIVIMRLLPMITGYQMSKCTSIIMNISCLGWFSYFYLGYLLGNNMFTIKTSTIKLICLWMGAVVLQIFEGYYYLLMGDANCGTQLKLTALLAGTFFVMIAYRFVKLDKIFNLKFLKLLGDASFGIYFSHLAIMTVVDQIPYYSQYLYYPINGIVIIVLSMVCVLIGKKILGVYGKYLAL